MIALAEAIERLEAMPEFLEAALEIASADELAFKPSPDEFSLGEQACHLRDLEREGYLLRVRRMMSEPAPELEGFDGAAVAASRNYAAQDARRAAQDFSAARHELVGLLAPLTPADLQRTATFEGRRITLGDLVAMIVAHDQGHREEIERLMEALDR